MVAHVGPRWHDPASSTLRARAVRYHRRSPPRVRRCGVTNWVIDLDGVMWRGSRAIPGSTEAVAELIERGDRVVFCTNNSAEAGTQKAARLVEDGLPEGVEVVTSADAVAGLVRPGEVALCLGGPGLRRALRDAGAEVHAAAEARVADPAIASDHQKMAAACQSLEAAQAAVAALYARWQELESKRGG